MKCCVKCNRTIRFGSMCKICTKEYENKVEAGRQANSEYRGDVPPTWSQRLEYGFALMNLDGDENLT